MNVVLHQEAIVLNLLSLESFLVDVLLRDLAREDLAADEISAAKDQLHLIQNEVNLLHGLQGPVSLDLDLLDQLCGIVMLSISLKHLSSGAGDLRVLSFQEHLALAGLLESVEHLVPFLSAGQLVQHSITHYPLYHVDYGLLGLTAALYQLSHKVAQVRQVVVVKRQTQLQSRVRPLT